MSSSRSHKQPQKRKSPGSSSTMREESKRWRVKLPKIDILDRVGHTPRAFVEDANIPLLAQVTNASFVLCGIPEYEPWVDAFEKALLSFFKWYHYSFITYGRLIDTLKIGTVDFFVRIGRSKMIKITPEKSLNDIFVENYISFSLGTPILKRVLVKPKEELDSECSFEVIFFYDF